MLRGNNYSGARWAFRGRASRDNLHAVPSEDAGRPLCPSCGRGYVVRRGVRCFTLPGDPRCERTTGTKTPSPPSPPPG